MLIVVGSTWEVTVILAKNLEKDNMLLSRFVSQLTTYKIDQMIKSGMIKLK